MEIRKLWIGCALTMSYQVMADDSNFTFIPRAEIGLQNYEYSFEREEESGNIEKDVRSYRSDVVGFGNTIVYKSFYLDTDIKTVLNKPSNSDYSSGFDSYENGYESFYDSWDETFSRHDLAITLGWGFGASSIFTGFKYGETEFERSYLYNNEEGDYSGDTIETFTYSSISNSKEKLKTTGIFIGFAHSISLAEFDSISLSLAYSKLNVDWSYASTDEYRIEALDENFDIIDFDEGIDKLNWNDFPSYDGDGFSFSAKWTHYLESAYSIFVKFDTQKYKYTVYGIEELELYSRLSFGVNF